MTVESFRKGIIEDDLKFAALIGFYPGCSQVWWERPRRLAVKHDAYYRLPGGERFANVKELSEELSRCTERGVSTGSNPSQASKAEQDVRRFVRVQFHLD